MPKIIVNNGGHYSPKALLGLQYYSCHSIITLYEVSYICPCRIWIHYKNLLHLYHDHMQINKENKVA